mmetsp:Transcript_58194/g.165471  ORF Transcript_58194/g.165471 Transcript_58194/m.165471 type:complete len:217 (-) Transcript_58194:161-811(-)
MYYLLARLEQVHVHELQHLGPRVNLHMVREVVLAADHCLCGISDVPRVLLALIPAPEEVAELALRGLRPLGAVAGALLHALLPDPPARRGAALLLLLLGGLGVELAGRHEAQPRAAPRRRRREPLVQHALHLGPLQEVLAPGRHVGEVGPAVGRGGLGTPAVLALHLRGGADRGEDHGAPQPRLSRFQQATVPLAQPAPVHGAHGAVHLGGLQELD